MNEKFRKEAEDKILKLHSTPNPVEADFERTLHDLQVHQIELEMQNDELKRTTRDLEQSQKRYSDLFDFAPVGYIIIDEKLKVLDLNYSAIALLGNSKNEIVSKSITRFIHPNSQDRFYFYIKDVLVTQKKLTEEILFCGKEGKQLHVQLQSSRDIGNSDILPQIRIAVTDITDRKNIEIKLKRFRAAMDSSIDNIFLIDYDQLAIIDVNNSACKNLGFTRKEFLQMNFQSIISQLTQAQIKDEVKNKILENSATEIALEVKHVHKDGNLFDVELIFKYIEIDQDRIIVAVTRDITERLKSRARLHKYANELKELNESKDRFLSIISHDLRGPFLGIKGYTQMLMEDYDTMSKEEIMSSLQTIFNSSKDLYNLVDNLLKWSRLQLGKMKYVPMSFNVSDELEPIMKLLTGVAQNKNITLKNELQKDIFAFADRLMLISVIQNLLSNAIKFTNEGGWVKVGSFVKENMIYIQVEDNGIGMDNILAENIFMLDKNHISRGTSGEKGTGFGLLIAKEMVNKMGGNIQVQSELGHGSLFTVSIVLARE